MIANKCDLPPAWMPSDHDGVRESSAMTGDGIDRAAPCDRDGAVRERAAARHAGDHQRAPRRRCCRARACGARSARREAALAVEPPEEFVLADLQEARARSRRSRARARPTTCCAHIFSGSASASNHGISDVTFDVIVDRRRPRRRARRRTRRRVSGCRVGLCTLSRDTVAHMPCNPAVGGTAKGHLVREIDALGGLMGRAIDATGIQFKLLNRSRGPAVWSPRAQADKRVYGAWVDAALEPSRTSSGSSAAPAASSSSTAGSPGSRWRTATRYRVPRAGRHDRHVPERADSHRAGAAAGRAARRAAVARAGGVARSRLASRWGRLKTGTPPRLDRREHRLLARSRQSSAATIRRCRFRF